jgi:hypothetical protein
LNNGVDAPNGVNGAGDGRRTASNGAGDGAPNGVEWR